MEELCRGKRGCGEGGLEEVDRLWEEGVVERVTVASGFEAGGELSGDGEKTFAVRNNSVSGISSSTDS